MKTPSLSPRLKTLLCYAAFLILYLTFRLHTFFGELVHDDGLFLQGAQAWAKGSLPYRDFWDHKPPGVFLYNALPLYFFPFSLLAVKVFQCMVLALSAVLLYAFCKRYVRSAAALVACVFYIYFTSLRYTVQSGGLTEEGGLLFVIFAYWLLSRRAFKPSWRYILAGISLGLAVQFRQTFLAEAVFAMGLIGLEKQNTGAWLKASAWLVLGLILPEAWFSLYSYLNGIWWDYIEASYLSNFYYIGPARPETDWPSLLRHQRELIYHTGFLPVSPIAAWMFFVWMPPPMRRLCIFLTVTFLGDCIAVSLSGEFYAHYYIQAAVTCAVFFALTVNRIIECWHPSRLSDQPVAKTLSVFMILACLYLSYQSGSRCWIHFQQVIEERSNPNSQYAFQQAVADAIHRISEAEDKILLIGRTPNSVYFLSERLAGSRFYHYSPLWKPSLQGAVTERQRQAFLDDLEQHQPLLLLFDLTRLRSEDGLSRVENGVPDARAYIQQHYTRLDELYPDIYTIWEWYDIRLQIRVRNDQTEAVLQRIEALQG